MKKGISNLLNDIFDDDDGLLYKWQHSGTKHHNSISKMMPDEVRQFLCPAIGIFPSKSMFVIHSGKPQQTQSHRLFFQLHQH
jgi:hypothetical protein